MSVRQVNKGTIDFDLKSVDNFGANYHEKVRVNVHQGVVDGFSLLQVRDGNTIIVHSFQIDDYIELFKQLKEEFRGKA